MRGAPLLALVFAACTDEGDDRIPGDTSAPEGDTATEQTWHRDGDGDGFGDPDSIIVALDAPSGFVADGSDCDDTDASVYPGAQESCNDIDDDCDSQVDEGLKVSTWYLDGDGDGFGDDSETMDACAEPVGHAATGGDCNDEDPAAHPGAEDVCEDGVDNDCDGGDSRCRLEGTISLSEAPAEYLGGTAGDLAGYQLACGGDTDGDGNPEILIGESEQFTDDYTGLPSMGGAWLVHDPGEGIHQLDSVGVPIWGDEDGRLQGGAAVFLGDTDGDGYHDVLMGSTDAQEAYLFRGPVDSARGRDDADAAFSQPSAGLGLGQAAATLDDGAFMVTGAGNLYQDGLWGALVGGAFVFEGGASGAVSTDEAQASLTPDVRHEYGYFGWSTCSGDFDGDGFTDIVIGAPSIYPTSYAVDFMTRGVAYVVYGPFSGDLRMTSPEGSLMDAEARIEGSSDVYNIGYALSCAGDADGDGLADILVGAPDWSGGYAAARGDALLFLDALHGVVDVEDADGRVTGVKDGEYIGISVSLDADLDGDGRHDSAIGSNAEAGRGKVSVFYGGIAGVITSNDAEASFLGEAEGDYAFTVSGCSDLDGDGFDDMLVGASYESTSGDRAGAAYVLFGGSGEAL